MRRERTSGKRCRTWRLCDGPRSFLNGCGGQNRFGIPFWLVGEFTTHFRTYFGGWIGRFTGGTIWILTHGQVSLTSPHQEEVRPPPKGKLWATLVSRVSCLQTNPPPLPEGHIYLDPQTTHTKRKAPHHFEGPGGGGGSLMGSCSWGMLLTSLQLTPSGVGKGIPFLRPVFGQLGAKPHQTPFRKEQQTLRDLQLAEDRRLREQQAAPPASVQAAGGLSLAAMCNSLPELLDFRLGRHLP